MKKYLLFKRVMPRWIIMLLDFGIVACSFTLSFFIVYRFEFADILRGYFLIYTGLYCITAFVVMYGMRIHKGLIRYSNIYDVMRIFGSMFISSLIYALVLNFWIMPVYHVNGITIKMIVLVNFSISSTMLVMARTAIKGAFTYIKNNSGNEKATVLIYGTDNNAILIKQALQGDEHLNFAIVGFIDSNPKKIDKEIQQIRVYDIGSLGKLKQKYNVEKLIIMHCQLADESRKMALEQCLNLGIQVLTVPSSDQWLYGKLSVRQIKDLKIEDLLERPPIQIDTARISGDLRGKRVLITGAAGSIGSEIVRQVLQYQPSLVILCDQAESPLHELGLEVAEISPEIPAKIFIADVRNYSRMRKLFLDFSPEIVFHAAAYKHVPMMEDNPTEAVATNVMGTKNIADLAIGFGVDKFVMISTDKAVNPSNVMGATKRIAEMYIQSLRKNTEDNDHNTRFITTRFGNVLGSNGSVIPRFKAQIEKGGPLTVTHPEIIRYFMTIPEAVHLVLEAGTMGAGGEIFIFDMGKPVKIMDLATKMIRLSGLQPEKDIKIVFSGLRPGEKLYEELLSDGENTMPTYHEKIKISQVRDFCYEDVLADIDELIALNKQYDVLAVVRKMKEIVPEFISKNSLFEELDNEELNKELENAIE
jgi:FlaA1/EpsC-like NDP-sugar epimerase